MAVPETGARTLPGQAGIAGRYALALSRFVIGCGALCVGTILPIDYWMHELRPGEEGFVLIMIVISTVAGCGFLCAAVSALRGRG